MQKYPHLSIKYINKIACTCFLLLSIFMIFIILSCKYKYTIFLIGVIKKKIDHKNNILQNVVLERAENHLHFISDISIQQHDKQIYNKIYELA